MNKNASGSKHGAERSDGLRGPRRPNEDDSSSERSDSTETSSILTQSSNNTDVAVIENIILTTGTKDGKENYLFYKTLVHQIYDIG